MITVDSIQIGKVITEGDPAARDLATRQWTSGFRKRCVDGPVTVRTDGIIGDEIADLKHHGGPEKAVLCYAGCHYPLWRSEHPELDFGPGGFGENLTIAGANESDVCIGDRLRIGRCELEVSQPRQPCWKISRRWQTKTLTKEVTQNGRTGWYLRVRSGGDVVVGAAIRLVHRPHPDWTISRANDVLFGREVDRMAVHQLMQIPELSRQWKNALG